MPSDPLAKRVGANVRAEMARSNPKQTQKPFAKRIGMSQQSLSRRLSGEIPFDLEELERVAAVLGVPMTRLVVDETAAAS